MRRLLLLAALLCLAPACRTAGRSQDIPIDAPPPPFVPGEALLRSDRPLTADALRAAAGLDDLVVMAVEPQFGQVSLVRFRRLASTGQLGVDEAYTRRAIEAFKRIDGVQSVEPNAVEQRRSTP